MLCHLVATEGVKPDLICCAAHPPNRCATGRMLPQLPYFSPILAATVATHLVISFSQILMHSKLGHHRLGARFFRNLIGFHHTYYAKDHQVFPTYLAEEGNNTPYFLIPIFSGRSGNLFPIATGALCYRDHCVRRLILCPRVLR